MKQEKLNELMNQFKNMSNKDILEMISELMIRKEIQVEDVMQRVPCVYGGILENIPDRYVAQYYNDYVRYFDEIYDKGAEPIKDVDSEMIEALSEYAHLKHRICDMPTVLDDIKELLTMRGYEKRML